MRNRRRMRWRQYLSEKARFVALVSTRKRKVQAWRRASVAIQRSCSYLREIQALASASAYSLSDFHRAQISSIKRGAQDYLFSEAHATSPDFLLTFLPEPAIWLGKLGKPYLF